VQVVGIVDEHNKMAVELAAVDDTFVGGSSAAVAVAVVVAVVVVVVVVVVVEGMKSEVDLVANDLNKSIDNQYFIQRERHTLFIITSTLTLVIWHLHLRLLLLLLLLLRRWLLLLLSRIWSITTHI
jgi:hypothetical protein